MRPLLGGDRKVVVAERHQAPGLGAGLVHPDHLDRWPGSGTNTQGPLVVWNSVEVLRCGRLCDTLKVIAV